MAPLRNHSLVTAYTILFTTAAGILGYDLATHKAPALPDLPVPAMRVAPAPSPAVSPPAPPEPILRLAPAPLASPEPPKPVAAAAVKAPRLAPKGVVFLTARVSLADDSGVRALNPGTRVKLLQRKGARLKVADRGTAFFVDASQVTDDVDAAEALLAGTPVPTALTARRN